MVVTPFLMFVGQAEEAMRFYVSTFPDAEILDLDRYGSGDDGPAGGVKGARFRIAEQTFRCFDSPVEHAFGFTPSLSFFVDCKEDAFDTLFERLSGGGSVLMPPDRYPFAQRFAWVSDRYGVSWQLNVA